MASRESVRALESARVSGSGGRSFESAKRATALIWHHAVKVVGEHTIIAHAAAAVGSVVFWLRSGWSETLGVLLIAVGCAELLRRAALRRSAVSTGAGALPTGSGPEPGPRAALIQLAECISCLHAYSVTPRVELFAYDETTKALRLRACAFLPDAVASRVYPVPELTPSGGTSHAGESFRRNRPLIATDALRDEAVHIFRDAADAICIPPRSLISVPIPDPEDADGRPAGVVTISSHVRNYFDDVAVRFLSAQAPTLSRFVTDPRAAA